MDMLSTSSTQDQVTAGAAGSADDTEKGNDDVAMTILCPMCRKNSSSSTDCERGLQANMCSSESFQERQQSAINDFCDNASESSISSSEYDTVACHCLNDETQEKLTEGHHDPPLHPPCPQAGENDLVLKNIEEQVKVIEAVHSFLEDEKLALEHQRQVIENDIKELFGSGVACLTAARDECLSTLAEAAQMALEKLQCELSAADDAHRRIFGLASLVTKVERTLPGTDIQNALLSEIEVEQFQRRMNRSEHFSPFAHKVDKDRAQDLAETFRGYLGTVVVVDRESIESKEKCADTSSVKPGELQSFPRSFNNEENPNFSTLQSHFTSMEAKVMSLATLVDDLKFRSAKLEERETIAHKENYALQADLHSLRAENSSLRLELTSLRTENLRVRTEIAELQKDKSTCFKNIDLLLAENARFQKETVVLQENNINFHKNITSVLETVDALKCSEAHLRGDIYILRQDVMLQQAKNINVCKELSDLWQKLCEVCQNLNALQGDKSAISSDITTMQAILTKLQSDLADCQGETIFCKEQLSICQTEESKVKDGLASVYAEVTLMREQLADLKDFTTSLRQNITEAEEQMDAILRDLMQSENQITELRENVSFTHDSVTELQQTVTDKGHLIDEYKEELISFKSSLGTQCMQISNLESKIRKASTTVVFHAILQNVNVTTTRKRILVMDCILTNIGGGYSAQTGVFTAPVTGTYIFLITTGPWAIDKVSRLVVVVDTYNVAFLLVKGEASCTAHAAVKISAGQKVWLETFDGDNCLFSHNWMTSFSGMLVQPEL